MKSTWRAQTTVSVRTKLVSLFISVVVLPMLLVVVLGSELIIHELQGPGRVFGFAVIAMAVAGAGLFGMLAVRLASRSLQKLATDLEQSRQQLSKLAITDGLTAIWNLRYFQLQFEQELERAQRFGRPFSLIILDIDDFKSFNDTHGHQVGDFVLIELTQRVKSVIRDVDIFARYGGEEFVLLLPETDARGAQRTAERVRAVIADSPFEGEMAPEPLKVTASLGVAGFPEGGVDRVSIFNAADQAMYKAKSLGKNCVVFHGAEGAA